MKKQMLISGHELSRWTERVNEYMNDGWKVVPESIRASTAVAKGNDSYSAHSDAFIVLLEKE